MPWAVILIAMMKGLFPLPYCVYVLLSRKDTTFHVGFTTDRLRRLAARDARTARDL
jgi:hypothetical protein